MRWERKKGRKEWRKEDRKEDRKEKGKEERKEERKGERKEERKEERKKEWGDKKGLGVPERNTADTSHREFGSGRFRFQLKVHLIVAILPTKSYQQKPWSHIAKLSLRDTIIF